jgi:hypothetical protein
MTPLTSVSNSLSLHFALFFSNTFYVYIFWKIEIIILQSYQVYNLNIHFLIIHSGLRIHVRNTNLGPYRTRWSTDFFFVFWKFSLRISAGTPATRPEISVVFLSPFKKIPDSTCIRSRPFPSKFIQIHQSSATLPSEAV